MFYCLRNSSEICVYVFKNTGWDYKQELFDNLKQGFVLTIANVAGMLLLGIARFFIDSKWGIEVFGMVSYSLVLVNFVLMFIAQLSSVLYPELRCLDKNVLNHYFNKIQHILLLLTPLLLITYFPVSYFIDILLPDYNEAAYFMIYMLPICIYEAKVMLQTNTYFKVLNQPKAMMLSNVEALFFGVVMSAISVYYFENVTLTIVVMPLTIFLQYIFSLKRLRPNSYIKDLKTILPEFIIILFFVLDNIFVPIKTWALIVYIAAIFVYIFSRRRLAKDVLKSII